MALLATNVAAAYGYYQGGAYSPLHYPNSYYDLSFTYWEYDGPYVSVSFGRYTPYQNSYYSSGCYEYWCYTPSPYYYAPYYSYFDYSYYQYTPGYYFGYNW